MISVLTAPVIRKTGAGAVDGGGDADEAGQFDHIKRFISASMVALT